MKNQYLRWLVLLAIAAIFLPISATAAGPKHAKQNNTSLTVTIHYKEAGAKDTLLLYIVNPFYRVPLIAQTPKIKSVMGKDSLYHFKLEHCSSTGYFQVCLLHTKDSVFSLSHAEDDYEDILPGCYFESGDNLFIRIAKHKHILSYQNTPDERFTISYSGYGSDKLTMLHECLDSLENTWHLHKAIQPLIYDSVTRKFNMKVINDRMSEIENIHRFFESRKNKLSNSAYYNLQADVIYIRAQAIINQMYGYYERKVAHQHPKFEKAFKDSVFKFLSNDPYKEKFHFPEAVICNSDSYLGYSWRRLRIECAIGDHMNDSDQIYQRIITEYGGIIRDRLIVYFFSGQPSFDSNINRLFYDAEKRIKDPFCHKQLEYFKTMLIGNKAYNFTLPDTAGRLVSLSDFKGKVVIVDVWFTGCDGCEGLYTNVLSKIEEAFRGNKNVIFVSVSLDMKKAIWREGRNSGLYTSPYVVNLYTNGLGGHHPFLKYAKVNFTPTTFIIDKQQNIRGFNNIEFSDINPDHLRDACKHAINQINSLLNENNEKINVDNRPSYN